jgi:hypothetical protein
MRHKFDVTNSEIAYLGYESGSTSGFGTGGLHYFGGDGSTLRGNTIHDLYFGFYSRHRSYNTMRITKSITTHTMASIYTPEATI